MNLQGLDITVSIFRRVQMPDDDIGGSVQVQSPIRTGVPGRIGNSRSPMMLRAQGIESSNMYDGVLQSPDYVDLDLQIDDVLIPEVGQYTGLSFVVTGVQDDSLSDLPNQDYRRHKFVSLRRIVEARRVQ